MFSLLPVVCGFLLGGLQVRDLFFRFTCFLNEINMSHEMVSCKILGGLGSVCCSWKASAQGEFEEGQLSPSLSGVQRLFQPCACFVQF